MAKKKALEIPTNQRIQLIDSFSESTISIRQQTQLLGVTRSQLYYTSKPQDKDIMIMNDIDQIYTERPFYGSRRMAYELSSKEYGHLINRKKVQRLMRLMGIEGLAPKKNLSKRNPEHKIFPYLLRNYKILTPNEVWSTDITYIRLREGFAFLVAVMDWYSRYILSWRLSNTMDLFFCLDALEEAFKSGKIPKIFNTDQGSQFTSNLYTNTILQRGILMSMDGRGRALDNIFMERVWRSLKYEDIYLKNYETFQQAEHGIDKYFEFYNNKRPHFSLDFKTPSQIHFP